MSRTEIARADLMALADYELIRKQKRNGIVDAIKASRKTWPTIVETI